MGLTKRLLASAFLIIATRLFAQYPVDGAHYPTGFNGIGAGIPDSTGFYVSDNNWIYTGSESYPNNYKTLVYLQAPQLMWLSGWTILGAHYGADVMIPFVYKEVNHDYAYLPPAGNSKRSRNGLGDIKLEPLLLVWQWNQFDLMTSLAVWAPSGYYGRYDPLSIGNDTWSPMYTLNAAWHPDTVKTWTISIGNHLEYNFQPTQQALPLSTYTLEGAVGKTIFDHVDVGVTGYYQQQINQNLVAPTGFPINSSVAGAGPEVSVNIPRWNLNASLRYDYEFEAHDRPRGDVVDLSVTKRF